MSDNRHELPLRSISHQLKRGAVMRVRWGIACVLAVGAAIILPTTAFGASSRNDQSLIRNLKSYTVPSGFRPDRIASGPEGDMWFSEGYEGQLGRITTTGEITESPFPGQAPGIKSLTADAMHRLWFTEPNVNRIVMMNQSGVPTEFQLPADDNESDWIRHIERITPAKGFMWFTVSRGERPFPPYSTERSPARIGEITSSGNITEFTLPDTVSDPATIAADSQGNLWFTENIGVESGHWQIRIRRMTPAGALSEKTLPEEASPGGIAVGPEGDMWFGERGAGLICKILRVTPKWQIRRFTLPSRSQETRVTSSIQAITAGPDGNMWFLGSDPSVVGRITPAGQISQARLGDNASSPESIVAGPDRSLWFTEWRDSAVTRLTPPKVNKHRRH